MKRLLTTTALGLILFASPSLAQTAQDTTNPSAAQSAQSRPGTDIPGATGNDPAATNRGAEQSGSSDPMKPDTARTGTETGAKNAGRTAAADVRASNLIGASVKNASGETVGEINDILFDRQGNAKDALIGVGGFLGMGEKNVAVEFSELNFTRNENGNLSVSVAMSTESLEALPAYTENEAAGEGGDVQTGNQTNPMKKKDRIPDEGSENAGEPKNL